MKLFIVAALIAVSSAGRLEHLERSYLPPDGSSGADGSFGSSGSGSSGSQNGGFSGPGSRQYLPPNQGNSGSTSNGFSSGGSAINSACSSCGSSRFPSQQHSQGPQSSVPSTSYGVPQFGSPSGSPNGFGSASGSFSGAPFSSSGTSSGSSFSSPSGAQESGNYGSQDATNRQYLAPAVSSQNSRQQPFDQKSTSSSFGSPSGFRSASSSPTGSAFSNSRDSSGSSFSSPNKFGSASGSPSGSAFSHFGAPSGSSFGSPSGSQGSQGAANRQYLAPPVSSQNSRQQPFEQKSASSSFGSPNAFRSASSSPTESAFSNSGVSAGSSFGSPNGFGSGAGSPSSSVDRNSGAPSGSSFSSPSGPQRFGNFGSQGQASRQYIAPAAQGVPQQPFDEKSGYIY